MNSSMLSQTGRLVLPLPKSYPDVSLVLEVGMSLNEVVLDVRDQILKGKGLTKKWVSQASIT